MFVGSISQRSLILPEIAEPLGRKFAISNRMLDVLVAEIVLQRPSIQDWLSWLNDLSAVRTMEKQLIFDEGERSPFGGVVFGIIAARNHM
jgi:hypothetical protein